MLLFDIDKDTHIAIACLTWMMMMMIGEHDCAKRLTSWLYQFSVCMSVENED